MKKLLAILLILALLVPMCALGETANASGDAEELPSLKEKYGDLFDIGTCVSQADMREIPRMKLVRSQYTIVTPENELKPDSVLDVAESRKLAVTDDTAVAVRFDAVKPILRFAQANGLKVHGHVLVWHGQTPEAFFHVGYDTKAEFVTREVMLARLDNYIRLVMAHMEENYPGVVVSWDVVNEAVSDGSTSLRQSNWTKVVGGDFVNRAFEIADKYAPEGVALYYNDYSTPYEPKTSGIVSLLQSLVADGHIDGYGFQTHYSVNEPSVTRVAAVLDRIIGLGLRLRVSEMDVKMTGNDEKSRAAQASYYEALFHLYVDRADHFDAVQFWGVCDATSWISASNPLIFDRRLQPKEAFWALVK